MEDSKPAVKSNNRFAFSLLNLFLGSALFVAVLSHVVASRELHQIKAEVKKLRTELGYLDIRDPKKCYVTYVPQLEEGAYLFRIYLPPGHGYSRKYSVESKSKNGESKVGGVGSISESGELTIRAKFYRDEAGATRLTISGSGSTSNFNCALDSALASSSRGSTTATAPSNETKEIEPGDPIELLSMTVEKSGEPEIRDTIKLWLEDSSAPQTPVGAK
jgi:hypothetical protein